MVLISSFTLVLLYFFFKQKTAYEMRISDWSSDVCSSDLAPKSLQKIRLVFRQVLELARGSGAIKVNPCDGIRLPRAVQSDPIFLSATQVESLARAARPPFDLLVRFAAATGLRPSEICGLRVGRLNLVKGTVEVAEALTVISGRTEVGPTKSYARRTVGRSEGQKS